MEWLYRIYGLILRRCKGFHKVTPLDNVGPFSVTLEYHKSAHRIKADELLRKATAYKKAGQWDKAISSLRKAYAVLGKSIAHYPLETALRLPLYLQQAGRYEEAQQEFERLLSSVDKWVAIMVGDRDDQYQWIVLSYRNKIEDKMRLAEKREQKRRATLDP